MFNVVTDLPWYMTQVIESSWRSYLAWWEIFSVITDGCLMFIDLVGDNSSSCGLSLDSDVDKTRAVVSQGVRSLDTWISERLECSSRSHAGNDSTSSNVSCPSNAQFWLGLIMAFCSLPYPLWSDVGKRIWLSTRFPSAYLHKEYFCTLHFQGLFQCI